jgi:drug/metabolite transporter (DMT)-like permease
VAVLFAAACWGTSGIFVNFVSSETEITALALAFWRDISTFAVLLPSLAIFRREWLRVDRKDLPWLIALGASLGSFHVFWNLAVMLNGAAVATVQQAAMPAIVAVVARLVWKETLNWRKIVAIALTFVGTVLVSGLDVLAEADVSWVGLIVGLGTPITYAAWTLFSKRLRASYSPPTVLTYAFGFGALVLLPFQLFTTQPEAVPLQGALWFVALILFSTVVPFNAYTFGLGRIPASVASILAMSEIPIVAVYAYVFLREIMTPDQIFGAVLVIAGVLLLSERRKREKAKKTSEV